jgi:pimeloyl-ACP methyl ester carboxylesterase
MPVLDCPPPCTVVVERIREAETSPIVQALPGLPEVIETAVALTGWGLETESTEGEVERLRRGSVHVGPPVDGPVGYLAAGSPAGRRVVFVHGSPGQAREWADYLVDAPAGLGFVAVDRPGFGDSRAEEPVTALAAHAAALKPFLRAEPEPAILVGYSFGAPVVVRAAIDYPDRVGGLVLIGGALDPALEEAHPLQVVGMAEPIEAVLPADLAQSNQELLALRGELERMMPDLARITVPVTIIHGTADTLVPVENVAYMATNLTGSPMKRVVLVDEADHFLPWTGRDLIEAEIGRLVRGPGGPDDEPGRR